MKTPLLRPHRIRGGRERRPRRSLAIAIGICGVLLGPAGSAGAAIPQSAVYDVQLQGNVNGVPFSRTGGMAVGPTVTAATSNGVNPIDLCLGSGSPFITPELGAIWFSTNTVCVNSSGARLDMAFVSADPQAGVVTIRPDPNTSATGANGFSQSSGLTGAVWQIFDGAMTVSFQGNGETVTGTIDFLGTGAIFHSQNRYTATLTGQARELTPGAGAGGNQGGGGAGGGLGGDLADSKEAQLAALTQDVDALEATVEALRIGTLLRRGGLKAKGLDAVGAGRFGLALTGRAAGRASAAAKPVSIARGSRTVSGAGSYTLKAKLTRQGKRLLRRARRVKGTLTLSFSPPTGTTVKRSAKVKLRR
jgi:hypothetical protein